MSDDPKDQRQDSISGRFYAGAPDNAETEDKTSETEETNKTDKTDTTEETAETEESTQTEETEETDEASETKQTEEVGGVEDTRPSVKDKQALTMYLYPHQIIDLDTNFQEVKLEYQREHGEKLEKNADFYPAVLEAAFSNQTVREILEIES